MRLIEIMNDHFIDFYCYYRLLQINPIIYEDVSPFLDYYIYIYIIYLCIENGDVPQLCWMSRGYFLTVQKNWGYHGVPSFHQDHPKSTTFQGWIYDFPGVALAPPFHPSDSQECSLHSQLGPASWTEMSLEIPGTSAVKKALRSKQRTPLDSCDRYQGLS